MKSKKGKFTWGGLHPFSYHPIVFDFIPDLEDKVVVDCGCGRGIWGYLIRSTRHIGRGQLIGVDINPEYIAFCKKFNVYDKLLKKDVEKLPFGKNSVDLLICSEVIEHVSRRKGVKLLNQVDNIIKEGGRAIITTPNIEIETVIRTGADTHHSHWNVSDFRKKGYKVYGIGIKIPVSRNKWYTKLVLALGHAFTPISYIIPSVGGFLIAIKDY